MLKIKIKLKNALFVLLLKKLGLCLSIQVYFQNYAQNTFINMLYINRILIKALQGKMSFETWYKRKPDISNLQV